MFIEKAKLIRSVTTRNHSRKEFSQGPIETAGPNSLSGSKVDYLSASRLRNKNLHRIPRPFKVWKKLTIAEDLRDLVVVECFQ